MIRLDCELTPGSDARGGLLSGKNTNIVILEDKFYKKRLTFLTNDKTEERTGERNNINFQSAACFTSLTTRTIHSVKCIVMYHIVRYCMAGYDIIWYCIVLNRIVCYGIIWYRIMCIVSYSSVRYGMVP